VAMEHVCDKEPGMADVWIKNVWEGCDHKKARKQC
jgi:hypothetical protein